MNEKPYGVWDASDLIQRGVKPKQYHTDLDNDFAPGELLPWQDMSRHLQALEHQVKTLEQALQTTTDSLKQAHGKIAFMEAYLEEIAEEEKMSHA